jgi:hypothetical protein
MVLDKYPELYKSLTVCGAAVVIHPAYKWEYFEVAVDNLEWTDDQLQDAKLGVQALWLSNYMPVSAFAAHACERQPNRTPPEISRFATWRAQRQRTVIGKPNNALFTEFSVC